MSPLQIDALIQPLRRWRDEERRRRVRRGELAMVTALRRIADLLRDGGRLGAEERARLDSYGAELERIKLQMRRACVGLPPSLARPSAALSRAIDGLSHAVGHLQRGDADPALEAAERAGEHLDAVTSILAGWRRLTAETP
jgi:hypothetical protein